MKRSGGASLLMQCLLSTGNFCENAK